tara:strand:+ start:1548 stop:2723 length:1176 start_codon:yes stop_codon:yes gene_type:complete
MNLLISTGEVSGDLQGSLLVKALLKEANKRNLKLNIYALGGLRMKEAGANLIADTSKIGSIGLFEAIPLIIPTLRIQSRVNECIRKTKFDAIVLIDYMGPNIRLGNKLRKKFPSLPIIYYIAPQEWAWSLGDGGTTDLIGFSDKILAIFKAEADFYSNKGGNVLWVGHPMVDTLTTLPTKENALNYLGIAQNRKVVLLFPASRSQELKYLMPTLAKAAAMMQKLDSSIIFIVPAGLPSFKKPLEEILEKEGVEGIVFHSADIDRLKPFLFAASDLAIAKSGTINMELALHNVPQIVGYKVGRLTALVAKKILKFSVKHISPVNLLLGKRLVPELVQSEFNPTSVLKLAMSYLNSEGKRLEMIYGYDQLREDLGGTGVTERASIEILNSVKN